MEPHAENSTKRPLTSNILNEWIDTGTVLASILLGGWITRRGRA